MQDQIDALLDELEAFHAELQAEVARQDREGFDAAKLSVFSQGWNRRLRIWRVKHGLIVSGSSQAPAWQSFLAAGVALYEVWKAHFLLLDLTRQHAKGLPILRRFLLQEHRRERHRAAQIVEQREQAYQQMVSAARAK